ncbi:unnamed protein product [Paramecium sonneborni]|uniref:OTU domain-containing protein n=1 Tax=Paramecium sonneborni TaxID=65129 RepID=A0A8S1MIK7_9CILI|nr:unnamed protein product [Paramecium sonneborni]
MTKQILARIEQFFQKIVIFDFRLTEVEEFVNSLKNERSISNKKCNDDQMSQLSIEIQQEISQQIKELLQRQSQEEQIWQSQIEAKIKNFQLIIEQIEKQKQNLRDFDQDISLTKNIETSPEWIEKNRINVQQIVNNIYEQTSRQRSVSAESQQFLHQEENQSQIGKYYKLKLEQKNQINQYCSGFRQVRGDGNCFYTAFGFQYLQILINQFDQNQYNQFIDNIVKKTNFIIEYNNIKLQDEKSQMLLKEEFIFRLNLIRNIEDRNERQIQLIKHFRAYEQEKEQLIDGCFYALSTIFFKNLSLFIIEQGEFKDHFLEKEVLLKWEQECNDNEIVISSLAKYLNIHIQVFFIDKEHLSKKDYNEDSNYLIILLLKPGHYNIGIQLK